MQKITYASLGALGEDFHQAYDTALVEVRNKAGLPHPLFIGGKARKARQGTFPDVCPSDTRLVLGHFQSGDRADAQSAIVAAQAAFPGWRAKPWPERIKILRAAAELMTHRQFEFAALLTLEVGKNRFEAIAEVSEAIDLILYYCQQMESHGGFEVPLVTTGAEQTKSVLSPYGVWAVVSPFNFPLALATGMAAGALVAGNTVVFKPASDTPWSGVCLYAVLRDAGLPDGAFNLVTGPGGTVGEELVANPGVDGFIFTGSQKVGLEIYHRFAQTLPKPCIVEMGGKNPALVMPSANLDDATEGVMRSAFGMGGQKCSACSRLYLHRDVAKPFLELLVEKTRNLKIGDPATREVFLGPLINAAAVKKFQRAVRLGKQQGRIVQGGRTLNDDPTQHGFFVEPTIVDRLPKASRLFQEEFFAPVLVVAEVGSLDAAIKLANTSDYGLTAGIFTNDEVEQKKFFEHIAAGVTYCNRRGGATTGAWPGVQSFGGWKGSGSSGKSALGPYYVQQFMREQSQTLVMSLRQPD
jgi:1-pyrroline-5-carboxylate dehydrogenase